MGAHHRTREDSQVLWHVPSILVASLLLAGWLGAYTGVTGPERGFGLFLAGIFAAALSALGLAGAAAVGAATGRAWRRRAVRGAVLPLLLTAAVLLGVSMGGAPPIHDITTDPEDGLAFNPDVAAMRPEDPREAVLSQQREHYPDIAPMRVPEDPATAFDRARRAAQEMPGWTLTTFDPATGRIEAVAATRWFRFRDDVVIRVRPDEGGARLDMRSRSRFGQSDLGANAARIRAFFEIYRRSS
jgi:uncharacterized protein (DUF1499 family)